MIKPETEKHLGNKIKVKEKEKDQKYMEKSEKFVKSLYDLPARELNDDEKTIFSKLIKIERIIGWERLVKKRGDVF